MEKIFSDLNEAQRQAVEQIDGPLLILAAPEAAKPKRLHPVWPTCSMR